NWARALQGKTKAPTSLSDETFDEQQYLDTYRANPFFLICYALAKLQLNYFSENFAESLENARLAEKLVHHLEGTIWIATVAFWNALTLVANYANAKENERTRILVKIDQSRQSLGLLAKSSPESYRVWYLIVSAEAARISGHDSNALELFAAAIDAAA